MESARVRGCVGGMRRGKVTGAGTGRPDRPTSARLADASRRQNGPRKTIPRSRPAGWSGAYGERGRRSRCGLVVSPASHTPSDTACPGEKAGSGREAAEASAGGCGVEDQVGRAGSYLDVIPDVIKGIAAEQREVVDGHRAQQPALRADG